MRVAQLSNNNPTSIARHLTARGNRAVPPTNPCHLDWRRGLGVVLWLGVYRAVTERSDTTSNCPSKNFLQQAIKKTVADGSVVAQLAAAPSTPVR